MNKIPRILKILSVPIMLIGCVLPIVCLPYRANGISITKVNSENVNFYKIKYNSDYHFDDYLNAGIKSDDDTRKFLSKEFFNGKTLPTPPVVSRTHFACTSFLSRRTNGEYNFGRNLDYWYDWEEDKTSPGAIVETNPIKGYKSLSNVYLPYFMGVDKLDPKTDPDQFIKMAPYFPLDGVNEKGVGVEVNVTDDNDEQTNQNDPSLRDIGGFPFLRLILDHASSVQDAIELVQQFNMHDSTFYHDEALHFHVVDKYGQSVIFEYDENDNFALKIVPPREGNTFDDETPENEYNGYQVNENFNAYDANWHEVDGSTNTGKEGRYNECHTLLKEDKGITDDPMEIVRKARMMVWNTWGTVWNLNNFSEDIMYEQNFEEDPFHFSWW